MTHLVKLTEALIEQKAFLNKDLDYCMERLGIYTQGGSMDHGVDVYSWRVGDIWVEAWFQSGVCISFESRKN
jgi:hypothetical protein